MVRFLRSAIISARRSCLRTQRPVVNPKLVAIGAVVREIVHRRSPPIDNRTLHAALQLHLTDIPSEASAPDAGTCRRVRPKTGAALSKLLRRNGKRNGLQHATPYIGSDMYSTQIGALALTKAVGVSISKTQVSIEPSSRSYRRE